jgi:hypothetical protein
MDIIVIRIRMLKKRGQSEIDLDYFNKFRLKKYYCEDVMKSGN